MSTAHPGPGPASEQPALPECFTVASDARAELSSVIFFQTGDGEGDNDNDTE